MKKFLTYCMLIVILIAGVTTASVSGNKANIQLTNSTNKQQSAPDSHQSSFRAADLFLSIGVRDEQIHLTNLVQQLSVRLFTSVSNSIRINYSTQISQQQFSTLQLAFCLKSAFKQLDGYYLYHLRKLLI